MLYRGYSKHELSQVETILKEFNIIYEISSDFDEIKGVDGEIKREPRTRPTATRDSAFYQVKIEKEEFVKLSPMARIKLEKHRIFEEMDSPFTEEELAAMGEVSRDHFNHKKKEQSKFDKVMGVIVLIGVVIGASLYLKNFFAKF